MATPPKRKRKRKKASEHDLPLIGWREWVSLPDLDVPFTKAKIDTGARTSSLHAFKPERFQRDGREWIRFVVHPLQRSTKESIVCEVEVLEHRRVRSSTGHASLRPVIRTRIKVAGRIFPIEMTLAPRDTMGFRMLLGRRAVRKRFAIDPGRSYLGGVPERFRKPRKKRKKKA